MWWGGEDRGVRGRLVVVVSTLASLVLGQHSLHDMLPTHPPEEDWGTLVAVTAVRGSTAKLPCDVTSTTPEDPVLLVLWYRNTSVTPVYSYDSRGFDDRLGAAAEDKGGDGGVGDQQWGDEEAWGEGQRAWFDASSTPAHLLVREVRGRDEGSYTCKVHFRASPSWSQRITLTVTDPPGFPRIQDEAGRRLEGPIGPYEDGATVRLMCLSAGEPPPGLLWRGEGVSVGGASLVEVEGGVAKTFLQVVASRATAGATVTCSTTKLHPSVTNASIITPTITNTNALIPSVATTTTTSDTITLTNTSIIIPITTTTPVSIITPTITNTSIISPINTPIIINTVSATLIVNLPPLSVRVSAPAPWVSAAHASTFTCRVVGASPRPMIQWWLNTRLLTPPPTPTRAGADAYVSSMELTPTPEDNGRQLKCKAFSPNLPRAALHDQLTLDVHFVPLARVNISGEEGGNVTVREGESVTFTCHLKANPRVYNVTWFYNGRSLRMRQKGMEVRNTTLRLPAVTAELRGLYTCLASNTEGDGHSNALYLNVLFPPVCQVGQRRQYVGVRGGSVSVGCSVRAYPAALTFTWALKRTPESPPERLESVGRTEGLTGRYTLSRLQEERVEVLCWAKNAVGKQIEPCKFTVYTQGRPGPVAGCKVDNHTASGFTVRCRSSTFRSNHTLYTLVVYAQQKQDSSSRGPQQQGSRSSHSVGQLLVNLTSNSPSFVVEGLQAGQEFAVVVRVSNPEGSSPPVVLNAFTLNDNAQTVIRMPTGLSGGDGGSGRGGASHGGGTATSDGSSGAGGDAGGWQMAVPTMVAVSAVVVVVVVVVVVAVVVVVVLVKRRNGPPEGHIQGEQVTLTEESTLVHTATSDTLCPNTTVFQTLHVDLSPVPGSHVCQSQEAVGAPQWCSVEVTSPSVPSLTLHSDGRDQEPLEEAVAIPQWYSTEVASPSVASIALRPDEGSQGPLEVAVRARQWCSAGVASPSLPSLYLHPDGNEQVALKEAMRTQQWCSAEAISSTVPSLS